ncbi:MAG: hypothetical protein JXL97_08780 [Bacteroidales bacterium]|nr:hypothetical protein [Bacteroidales bacterium]
MRRFLLFLLPATILFLAFIDKDKSDEKKSQILVLSYNVENLFDTIDSPYSLDEEFTSMSYKDWNTERYFKKINDLATVFTLVDDQKLPDIISLCEVENLSVIEDLKNNPQLAAMNYQIVHEETTDPRGIDVALMYNPEVFKYISHEQLQIFEDDGKLYNSREILFVKGIVGKDTLYVFVNHWKSRSGGAEKTEYKRIWYAKVLREKIDYIFSYLPDANIICMGDFNDTPFDKSINEYLNASLDSVFENKNELFNLTAFLAKKGKGTYSYDTEWFMLDNIIVSQSIMNKKNGIYAESCAKVLKNDFLQKYNSKANDTIPFKTYGGNTYFGGVSDHFAVYAYFTVRK